VLAFCSGCQELVVGCCDGEIAGLCTCCKEAIVKGQITELVHFPASFASKQQERLLWLLYQYQGELRRIVLQAKVKSDPRALALLVHLFLGIVDVHLLAKWADIIVPMPSSLWGRLRGRFDCAAVMAEAIAKEHAKPISKIDGLVWWRWRKQAFKGNYERECKMGQVGDNAVWQDKKILLIDDVATTGATFSTIADMIGASCDIRGVALAGAAALVGN
jgi:predicted amidophosphoribosyltransferase